MLSLWQMHIILLSFALKFASERKKRLLQRHKEIFISDKKQFAISICRCLGETSPSLTPPPPYLFCSIKAEI